ncbi:uncharacterized protein LOC122507140 [Leptopilina heterotoma]|uniref:uncharacterized protein LOC122507140 n=1 Tax=Leptopilina heterotoma TaxID=63436 RepID=UPI001CA9B3D6|nr:uncharacterized protein LOC122507140 [Leptopilina heterotoma]
MKNQSLVTVTAGFLLLLLALVPEVAHARPSGFLSRQKRVSDQRLAELETLMALSRLKGKLVTVPVGFGRVDPAKIGRKRRSNAGNDFQRFQRFLRTISESELTDDESKDIFPASWFQRDVDNQLGDETDDPPLFFN